MMFVGFKVIVCLRRKTQHALRMHCMCNSSNSMTFIDIKDPANRTALVDEYVKAMKTVRRRNMVNRESKLAIGEELQTLFHPIVSATKQAAEKTAEELVPMKKAYHHPQHHRKISHLVYMHQVMDGMKWGTV